MATAAQNRGHVFNIIHLIFDFLFLVFGAGFQSCLQYPSLTNAMHALFFLASIYKVAYPSDAVLTKKLQLNAARIAVCAVWVLHKHSLSPLYLVFFMRRALSHLDRIIKLGGGS